MKLKLMLVFLLLGAKITYAQQTYEWKTGASGGYMYKYVTNDPTKTRFYTLKNGLTVILSQNNKEPSIIYKMAVRAGSNNDPRNNTGLAHYLEHLLFKGTDKFGTLNYAKEKPYLSKVETLYETYNKTTDPAKRREIYREIDKASGIASNYSIANEYDKMMKSIGSNSTNAHTSVEETVYEEDLPSNMVDKFIALQAERFRSPVFRIFHTELEAVYEEKNRTLDDDGNKMYEKLSYALFPTHNYGQQTTIGTVEHLKNPSLVEIRKFYNKYYVPNNMALIMSGDIQYDELIKKIDRSFAYMKPKPLVLYNPSPERPRTKVQIIDVYGPSAERFYIAYRGFKANSQQSMMLEMITRILANGKAGLMDININKQQQMLRAGASYEQMKDYGIFILSGTPKAGQSFEEAQKLLLAQIDLLKKGEFDESLIKATVANDKLRELQQFENNSFRANAAMVSFIQSRGKDWNKDISFTDDMGKVTKSDLVAFARKFFVENYVVVLKHKGEDKSIVKVDKPAITPVKTNTDEVSMYARQLINAPVKPIAPKFLDYQKDISFGKTGSAEILAVKNTDNSIFRLGYRVDIGAYNDKYLPIAAQYLSFLGTDKYSSEDIGKAFYNMACNYSVSVGEKETTVSVSGLQENFEKAVTLVEHILANCKPDEKALESLKSRILKSRENAKLSKQNILNGLVSYATYGADNPFNYGLTDDEIKALKSSELISRLHQLTAYKHMVTYYGPKSLADFTPEITKLHHVDKDFLQAPPLKTFSYVTMDQNKVYFADYDMVQAEIAWVRNSGSFDPKFLGQIAVFNDYFGNGMGSVVFQTIRESKALAYSTYATYDTPNSKEKQNSIIAYVGAQADKMNDAIAGMNALLTTMPESEKSFSLSKGNALNSIETSRVNNNEIIGFYLGDKKRGFDQDSRIATYAEIKPLNFSDVKTFHQNNISGKSYSYCVVASENKIKLTDLEKIGAVHKLTLSQIFGY